MWHLSLPWWEFVLRALLVYIFVFALLRFVGKKQIGQLTPFDFVLLLIISNAVQNSMNGGDNTVTAGIILAGTLVLLNYGVDALTFKSRKAESLIDGEPQLLVHNGLVQQKALKESRITPHELESMLRSQGVLDIKNVHCAILESNGHVSVIRKEP